MKKTLTLEAIDPVDLYGPNNRNLNAFHVAVTLKRGLSRVAGRRDKNKRAADVSGFSECANKKAGHYLQGHILERRGRPVPEFKNAQCVACRYDRCGTSRERLHGIRASAV